MLANPNHSYGIATSYSYHLALDSVTRLTLGRHKIVFLLILLVVRFPSKQRPVSNVDLLPIKAWAAMLWSQIKTRASIRAYTVCEVMCALLF